MVLLDQVVCILTHRLLQGLLRKWNRKRLSESDSDTSGADADRVKGRNSLIPYLFDVALSHCTPVGL